MSGRTAPSQLTIANMTAVTMFNAKALRRHGWWAMLALAGGCAPSGFYANPGSPLPTIPGGENRCRVAASQSAPLVTEWPASEKANLEGLLGSGAVAVAYSG